MKAAKPDRGLTAQAEPLLQDRRHKALVALAPAKKGTSAAPNLRDLVELECDTSAVSNAARLIRIGAPDSVVRSNARRDCTAMTNDEWGYLLAARDLADFKARFAKTKYGPVLGHHEYSVLKEGFFHYRCDWCKSGCGFQPTQRWLCCVTSGWPSARYRIWITSSRACITSCRPRKSRRCWSGLMRTIEFYTVGDGNTPRRSDRPPLHPRCIS